MPDRALSLFLLLLVGLSSAHADDPASPGSLAPIFKRVRDSVVVVRTSERTVTSQTGGQAVSVSGLGSGVLVSADGKIITAAHGIQGADIVGVEFPNGFRSKAQILASDTAADVALLQLADLPKDVVPAKLGDSDKAQVGDQVFVVGAPLGISHTLTVGHIS